MRLIIVVLFLFLAGLNALSIKQFIFLLPAMIITIDVIKKLWENVDDTIKKDDK